MTIEIVILSGSRQGEQIRLDDVVFHAGGTPACTIAFDPNQDPGCLERQVNFWLEESGWKARSVGSRPVILNQDVLHDSHPIRSGDVVRFSENGPDFSFHLVTSTSSHSVAVPKSSDGQPGIVRNEAQRLGKRWIAPAVMLLVTVLVVTWALLRSDIEPDVQAPTSPSTATSETTAKPPPAIVQQPSSDSDVADAGEPPGKAEPREPGGELKANAEWNEAIHLLVVQHPESDAIYPYGTAFAIRNDTLLTCGTVALEVARRRQAGWKCFAARPDDLRRPNAAHIRVLDLRVHQAFEAFRESPNRQIFFDLALVTIDSQTTSSIALAVPSELDTLEEGQPVDCVGIPHEGERVTRFDALSAVTSPAKILYVTPFPPEDGAPDASSPRLLQLEGVVPANCYGGPILTRQRRAVGVYAERAELPPEMSELHVHYAPLVTLVSAWLSGQGDEQWVTPTLLDQQPPTPKP